MPIPQRLKWCLLGRIVGTVGIHVPQLHIDTSSECRMGHFAFNACMGICTGKPRAKSFIIEPGHEKTCLMSFANKKGADQPALPRSLISAFIVRCLDSVMSLVSVIKISSLMLASVAEHASLSLTWSETPEDTFSHDEAQLYS